MQYDSYISDDLGKEYLISIIIKGGNILITLCPQICEALQGLAKAYGIVGFREALYGKTRISPICFVLAMYHLSMQNKSLLVMILKRKCILAL
jgi:hypothetical protein